MPRSQILSTEFFHFSVSTEVYRFFPFNPETCDDQSAGARDIDLGGQSFITLFHLTVQDVYGHPNLCISFLMLIKRK